MRTVRAILAIVFSVAVIYLLDHSLGSLPPIGRLLDPMNGCWANAEPINKDFSTELDCNALQHPVTVWLDERMVPHIHAADEYDAYFIEGYIHACFRLWQMDMETRAAAGRISEILGPKALNFDRLQRRKGMVYGAENSLKAMEAEPHTRQMLDAYTAGVNHYISSLTYKTYPLEYKLMNFKPEAWTNIKCALLLKYMADDLTGYTEDIPLTLLRDKLPTADFNMLYPEKITGSNPVIPSGTPFAPPSLSPLTIPADSVWAHLSTSDFNVKRDDGTGSNNWAISGTRTQNGAPILCNDPHLGLHLPSLWFEVQLQTPDMNVYGVSLPGTPGVVIGFNDSMSWGFTNNYRDVKDFYEVKQVAGDSDAYWFAGKQLHYTIHPEHIKVKDSSDYIDNVRYTVQGPVIYDKNFPGPGGLRVPMALCWMAHRPTNELLAIYGLNHARTYDEFVDAIMNFQCPAQNMIYADKSGNIALWGQGQFVNKWKEQGRFVMNGADSDAMWKELIPMRENPHVLNPPQGYLCSANQSVTDSTYPYWYNGYFYEFRAWRINYLLSILPHATIQDMFAMQNDTYSILAANTLPIMLRYMPAQVNGKQYLDSLKNWNYRLSAHSAAATIYQLWWQKLYDDIWKDDFAKLPVQLWPLPERTMQLLQTDTTLKYYDDITTPQTEHLGDIVQRSYKEVVDTLNKLVATTGLQWYKVKNTTVQHLAKLASFSYNDLQIGGWGNTINAAKSDHGPSWRMVVQMSKNIDAYGVYPGGQSGNPGSKYYADFLSHWVQGKYYHLQFLPNTAQQNNKSIKYTWTIKP